MKKTVISALSLGLVFVMLFALVACGGGSHNGTYYLYDGEECDMESYLKISGNKWSAEDGTSGKCEISGNKITLSYVLDEDNEDDAMFILLGMGEDGDSIEMMSGTIEDGKITFTSAMGIPLGDESVEFYLDGKVK